MIAPFVRTRAFRFSTGIIFVWGVFLLSATTQPVFAASTATQTVHQAQQPAISQFGKIRGVQGDQTTPYPHIPWLRLAYASCGSGNLTGQLLRNTIHHFQRQGMHVLLTVCQPSNIVKNFFDPTPLQDASQGGADAVQCGNEEMKQDPSVAFLYIPPDQFARWYDMCEQAMHGVRPGIPVLLGSLDPHVGGIDYLPLLAQVHYLDQMQSAMNTKVHPGGHWNWHTQTLGLIDTWHNGYPSSKSNSLYGLFVFWAQQFNVDLASGALGQYLWVVEGTGCFVGCGLNAHDPREVAVSHIITLITDVLTAKKYNIPFFFFSGRDFLSFGIRWPIGILDLSGNDKPIRQDLSMGARVLTMRCPSSSGTTSVSVQTQEDLLAKLYANCALPANYVAILES